MDKSPPPLSLAAALALPLPEAGARPRCLSTATSKSAFTRRKATTRRPRTTATSSTSSRRGAGDSGSAEAACPADFAAGRAFARDVAAPPADRTGSDPRSAFGRAFSRDVDPVFAAPSSPDEMRTTAESMSPSARPVGGSRLRRRPAFAAAATKRRRGGVHGSGNGRDACGRHCRVEPLDSATATPRDLFAANSETARGGCGPICRWAPMRPSRNISIAPKVAAVSEARLTYAIVDPTRSGRGRQLSQHQPQCRQHRGWRASPIRQAATDPGRDRGDVPDDAAGFRRAGLSPLRMEVQFVERAVAGGGRASRLSLRGPVPPGRCGQGRQPRHRLVLDRRRRVAGAEGRLRRAGSIPPISTAAGRQRESLSSLTRPPPPLPAPRERRQRARRSPTSATATVIIMTMTLAPNTQRGAPWSMMKPNISGPTMPPILKPLVTMPKVRPIAPGGAAARTSMSRDGMISPPSSPAAAHRRDQQRGPSPIVPMPARCRR